MSTFAKLLFAGALMSGATFSQPVSAQTKWDLSTVWPEGNYHTQNAKRFAEEIKTATNGAVEITVKAGGQLGFKGPEHLRAVRDGLVPMADVLLSQQIGEEPFLEIETIPFLMNDADNRKVLHKYVRTEIEKIFEKNGQIVLYMVPWQTLYLTTNTKVEKYADLNRLKVRVPDKSLHRMLSLSEMAPVFIPWGEVVSALSSGAVQGVMTTAASVADGKFWEFLKYAYRANYDTPSQAITVNVKAWNKLTAEQRKTIIEVAKKLEPEFWALAAKKEADAAARLRTEGMQVADLPTPVVAEMREKTKPMLDEFIKRVPNSGPLLKAYLAERDR